MLLGDRVRWHDVELVTEPDDVDAALLVAVVREGRTTLLGRGDPDGVVRLVARRVAGLSARGASALVDWMSLPRGVVVDEPTLDASGLAPFSTWDWMVTDEAPARVPVEDAVVPLDPTVDADAIRACLAESNPGTTAQPTGPDEAAWFGVRDGAVLAGVVGAARRGARTPGALSWHLHGLGVRPTARGRGIGAALTATATRAGLAAGASWVSLGLYADNDAARRIYRRLGYVTEGEFASFGPPGARRPST